jgi:hypothetical protein
MNKNNLAIIIILLSASSIFAQTQKYDIYSYTPPKGWESQNGSSAKVFTKIDKAKNSLGIIMLYPSINSSGDANDDFKYVWKQIVQDSFGAGANPEIETGESNGFKVVNGGELIKYEGIQALAMLTVLSGKGKVISILTITNEQSYANVTQSLIEGMVIDAKETAKVSTNSANSSSSLKINPNANTQTSIEGVWMTNERNTFGQTSSSSDITYRVFFKDGTSRSWLPNGGLLNYSPQNDSIGKGGKYTYSNGKGINYTTDNASSKETIALTSPTRMKIDDRIFYKCASVNNLTFEGSFTSVGDWKNTDFNIWQEGKKPILQFNKNGTFVDRGIFTGIFSRYNENLDRAGKGKYLVKDFTLQLQFDDGRVKELGFNLFLDAATIGNIVYFERTGLHKMR